MKYIFSAGVGLAFCSLLAGCTTHTVTTPSGGTYSTTRTYTTVPPVTAAGVDRRVSRRTSRRVARRRY